ncbi:MAG TPA: hypothetical protein VM537_10585 [Anaerolineae bacterium]|nr:hypothetical protein [Anaerolineae bacterium]
MYQWRKDIARWEIADMLYLSVPFTWLLPRARAIAQQSTKKVVAGGPAVELMPEYLADVATIGGDPVANPLSMHNPLAGRSSEGCPNACRFCINQTKPLRELTDWEPRPTMCDDNFLACSRDHITSVVDKLAHLPMVDFNQGLDASKFPEHMDELRRLPLRLRFAWDSMAQESVVMHAVRLAQSHGMRDIRCYVLVGFNDTPEDATYRCRTLTAAGVHPNPMRYQPLDALTKDAYVGQHWTDRELHRFCRYWFRQLWGAAGIPYAEFDLRHSVVQSELFKREKETQR